MTNPSPLIQPPDPFERTAVSAVLVSAFTGEMAESFGFRRLDGGSAVDLGAGDGRYTHILSELGASSVTAVERHQVFIDEGRAKGWLSGEVACSDLIDWAQSTDERFDLVSVMNIAPGEDRMRERNRTVDAASGLVKVGGQLLITTVEVYRAPILAEQLEHDMTRVTYHKTWSAQKALPAHNAVIVGRK